MHSLAAELMIGVFVFLIIKAGESVLMSNLLVGAGGTIMPILHVKTAGETHFLVSPLFNQVRISGIRLVGWLDADKDTGNHLIPPDKNTSDWSA